MKSKKKFNFAQFYQKFGVLTLLIILFIIGFVLLNKIPAEEKRM